MARYEGEGSCGRCASPRSRSSGDPSFAMGTPPESAIAWPQVCVCSVRSISPAPRRCPMPRAATEVTSPSIPASAATVGCLHQAPGRQVARRCALPEQQATVCACRCAAMHGGADRPVAAGGRCERPGGLSRATARTSPPPRRTEVTSPSIPASALRRPCGHGRVAAPGARSAGGAALWPAGAASCGVRMPLRGDAWRRGSPRVYRWPCERPGGLSRAPARTALRRGIAEVRFEAARRGQLDLRTQREANPQRHQRFMACSCAATVVHETPLLCVTRTAGRAAS